MHCVDRLHGKFLAIKLNPARDTGTYPWGQVDMDLKK